MAEIRIGPSILKGALTLPSSKSHTLRAILFAAMANGVSRIERFLPSPDTEAMIDAVRLLGAEVEVDSDVLIIRGVAGALKVPENVIQCGNSGQVLRFIGALAGLIPGYTILTGDASIRNSRPVKPLLGAMDELGAFAVSSRGDGQAPIIIKGPFSKRVATLDGKDSQPVSGLLIAGAFAPHPIEIHVTDPGEKPWIDLTLDWFQKLGIPYSRSGYSYYRMEGGAKIEPFTYKVPGDFSSAAFPITAALLTNSELTIENIDMEDVQGDKAIIPLLEKMGAKLTVDKERSMLKVEKGGRLVGMQIDVNDFIDALPILAVIGCFAEGKTELVNGAIARKKESDRISSMARELKKMGADIVETPDGLIIHKSILKGAELNTYHDHRLALSLSVAAMAASGGSLVRGIECVNKTYPSFFPDFLAVGASAQYSKE